MNIHSHLIAMNSILLARDGPSQPEFLVNGFMRHAVPLHDVGVSQGLCHCELLAPQLVEEVLELGRLRQVLIPFAKAPEDFLVLVKYVLVVIIGEAGLGPRETSESHCEQHDPQSK